MATVTETRIVDSRELDEILQPRDDLVAEQLEGPGVFGLAEGPFDEYLRTVTHQPADGGVEVIETVTFRVAAPFWRLLFTPAYRAALRPHRRRKGQPWWAPPQRLDARASTTLAMLCTMAVLTGYLANTVTYTVTFAASEFDASDSAQGVTLASIRVGVLLALALVSLADRIGRRPVLLGSAVLGCLATAAGAASTGMILFGATQSVTRAASTAMAVMLGVMAAEEMPAGSRAYGFMLMTASGALGAGMVLWVLPVADTGDAAWRIVFVVPLLGIPLARWVARHLQESRRFGAPHADAGFAGHGGRLLLIAGGLALFAIFSAPASEFQNEYLREERDFSATRISLFTMLTATPAAVGLAVGGRLADVRGRRTIAAIGIVGTTTFAVGFYLVGGWMIWPLATLAISMAGLATPALQVYGPEMFPTSLRGRANGVIRTVIVVGSVIGLVGVGLLSDVFDALGPALAIAAVGPVALVVLVLTVFPETARLELEDLNPEDRTDVAPGLRAGRDYE